MLARTVCLNESKGNSIFRTDPDYRVLLFLICRETDLLGQYIDSDFAIVYFKILIDTPDRNAASTTDDSIMDESNHTDQRGSVQELKADSELV